MKYRKPHSFKKKKSVLKRKAFWFSLGGFIIFCLLFYFLYFSPLFQIKNIIVEKEEVSKAPGVLPVSEEIIERSINLAQEASFSRIFFLENKSIFLFNSGSLQETIKNNNPELGEVKVRKKWPDRINIYLEKKKGVARLETNEGDFLVSADGSLFEKALTTDDILPLIIFRDSFPLKETMLSKKTLFGVVSLNKDISFLGLKTESFLIISKEKLAVKMEEGWEAYFDLLKDLDWQIKKLESVLENKISSEKREHLEYIEVRFFNQVFIKYRD